MSDPKDFSNKVITKQSQLGVPIGDKVILGQLTSYNDGSAKWTYVKDTNPLVVGGGDRSTFTLYKKEDGSWTWTPTTSTSIPNLANREGFTADDVEKSLYVKSGNLATSQTQTVLNAGNVTNLGGINSAKKLGVPGTTGKATVTGTLPSEVSGGKVGDTDETSKDQTGTSETEDDLKAPNDAQNQQINEDIKSQSVKTRNNFSQSLKYPLDLQGEYQDVIKFNMVKFRPTTISNQGGSLNPLKGKQGNQQIIGTVTLPVPSGISDANAVSWNGENLDPFQAIGVDIAQSAIVQGIGAGVDSAGAALQNAQNNSGDLGTAIATQFVQAATGASNLLSRTRGAIINPNLELLFQAPTLRPFNFTFKLSARSQREAEAIRSIIRFFKQGMSPIRTTANLFLKAPHTFQIEYRHRNKPHNYLNKFKECALQSFNVDYTPEGQYATFTDGAMVSYQITMQFQELEPVFNDDYDLGTEGTGRYDTEIGY